MPEDVKELFDGDAKKFVNDILVGRQHYLQRVRVQGPDPEVEAYEYSWGERANLEVKKSDILKMVVELYDCEPRMFKEQFDKVQEKRHIIEVRLLPQVRLTGMDQVKEEEGDEAMEEGGD